MRIRSSKDFWSGVLFIAIAAGFMIAASHYRLGTAQRMGPAYFPIAVGSLLALLGAIVAARSFVLDGPAIGGVALRPLAVSIAAVVLFGIALSYLGLVAAIIALVLAGSLADRATRPLESLALAAGLTVFSVIVFVHLLGLPLPVWPEF